MDNAEKTYTKDEVNKIVEERLSRERKNSEKLSEIKDFLFALREKGIIEGKSNKELAEALLEKLKNSVSEDTVEAEESEDVTAQNPDVSEEGENAEANDGEFIITAQLEELKEKHPELDIKELFNSEEFESFYDAFTREFGEKKICVVYEAFDKAKKLADELSMKRTPTVKNSKSSAESMLTPTQRRIAASAGMSYREYAKLLSEIPDKRMRK